MRAGTHKKMSAPSSPLRLLDFANDWKMQIDLNDNKLVFPPVICSTSLRPDIVLWSPLSRTVSDGKNLDFGQKKVRFRFRFCRFRFVGL